MAASGAVSKSEAADGECGCVGCRLIVVLQESEKGVYEKGVYKEGHGKGPPGQMGLK
jgi:hypothetical protein